MPDRNPHRPFTPDPEFMSLLPEQWGNPVNGLGESEVRRPDVVWWATDVEKAPFGAAQKWFYTKEVPGPELIKERAKRQEILATPLPEIADKMQDRSPADWTLALERFVAAGDCERVGVTRMQPEWAYQGTDVPFTNVIMLAVQHDYEKLKSAPDQVCGTDV